MVLGFLTLAWYREFIDYFVYFVSYWIFSVCENMQFLGVISNKEIYPHRSLNKDLLNNIIDEFRKEKRRTCLYPKYYSAYVYRFKKIQYLQEVTSCWPHHQTPTLLSILPLVLVMVQGPRNSTIEWGLLKAGAHSFLPVTDGVVTEDPAVMTDTEYDPRLRYKSSLLVQVRSLRNWVSVCKWTCI